VGLAIAVGHVHVDGLAGTGRGGQVQRLGDGGCGGGGGRRGLSPGGWHGHAQQQDAQQAEKLARGQMQERRGHRVSA